MTYKSRRILFFVVLAAIVIVVAYAVYGFCLRKSIPTQASEQEKVVAILEQNDCFVCHASEPQLPFYTQLPVMKQIMAQHVKHAQLFLDLKAAMESSQVDEVTLAKIEHAMQENTMPIMQYKMVHWGTGFNKKEKDILPQWLVNQRAQYYATGQNAQWRKNEPIQAIPDSLPVCPRKVALGKKMYYDTRISLDGTISCATCHILDQGGVSNPAYPTSEGINGQFGDVNAPTVYNAYFNFLQFWDGRAADLQEQAAGPPANPVEMGDQTWDEIVERLSKDKALVKEFEALYPGEGLTQNTVTAVIAEFEKTLITPNNPFDLYLKGTEDAISEQAKQGYLAFKKNSCAACHIGVNAGGQSFEVMGIYDDYFTDSVVHTFKVPGLRNVALTAPYFHDGSKATLEEAVEAMFQYELGKQVDQETESQIVEFLKTL